MFGFRDKLYWEASETLREWVSALHKNVNAQIHDLSHFSRDTKKETDKIKEEITQIFTTLYNEKKAINECYLKTEELNQEIKRIHDYLGVKKEIIEKQIKLIKKEIK